MPQYAILNIGILYTIVVSFNIKKGTLSMTVSYIGLWKLLLEKGLQKQDLVDHAGLSSATVAKMGRGEPVSNKVLEKICKYLDCNINEIMSFE